MDLEADVASFDAHVSDAPQKGKRSSADEGATQPARKKPNRKPTTSQQQQQQQNPTVLPDTQNGSSGNIKLQEQVNRLLSREGVSTDLEPLPPLPRSRPPTRGHNKQQQPRNRPQQMLSPLSPTTGVQQLLAAAAAESGFASASQQGMDLPAAAAAEPQNRPAGRDAGCAGVAAALASLRSTSSGLEESAVAAAGLLALAAAAAAGGNSPCSSPRVTTGLKQEGPTQQQHAAAAEDPDGTGAAAHTLTDAFPAKSALDVVAAAFPAAAAAAAHRAVHVAPAAKAAAAAGPRPPGPITADGLVVSDVGTFMGNRMFKTPFTSWASWLKGAGPGSDAVLQTAVSELLPNFSPWHQHLRQQVASKSRGGPGLAAWTARGYMCYTKLVVEKLQQQQPDVDHKQLLRKATVATNEFEQMARHGRSFEASPPASPKASASSRGSKATAFKGKAAASRRGAAATAAAGGGGARKPRARRNPSGSTDGDHSDQEEASAEQQQQQQGGTDGSMLAAAPAGADASRLPPAARGSMLRPRRGAAAAAAGVTASSDSQGGMVYGLLEPIADLQAATAAAGAGPSSAVVPAQQPALETSNPELMLQTLRAYAAEVEAVANLAALDGVDTPSHTPSLGEEGGPSLGCDPSLGAEGGPLSSDHQLPDGTSDVLQQQPPSDVMQQPEDEQQQQMAAAMGPMMQLSSDAEPAGGVLDPALAAAAAADCAMEVDFAEAAAAAGEGCEGLTAAPDDATVMAVDTADAVMQHFSGDTAAAAVPTVPPPAGATAGSGGWVSLSALQQQLGGCDGGLQVLWDVAQARHGVDVSGSDVDAADLLLSCTDPDTLQACEQALDAVGEAGEGEEAVQSQLYQTLEVVSGLLQLLQQPAVEQLLGVEQHRQRLGAVSAVYEGLHAAAGDSPTSSGPGGDDLYGEPSAALAMACNTAIAS